MPLKDWQGRQHEMMTHALDYIANGISVIPLQKNKRPVFEWAEFQKRIASPEEVQSWWKEWPFAMIGIVTGKISGLAVVDCDSHEAMEVFERYLPEPAMIPVVVTPRLGRHYYFRYQDGIYNAAGLHNTKIDIRGEGGYVVAPPSVSDTGLYIWCSCFELIKDIPVQDLTPMPEMFLGPGPSAFPSHSSDNPSNGSLSFEEGNRDETI
ncbi:MAG: hypothetical protein EHM36_11520, partial [Deltaproteobacteria bacterium]